MANTKQKPVPEGANRRPGKSRFSIPQKEAPPIDGSYLERLFADYEKQSQELEQGGTGVTEPAESSTSAAEISNEVVSATALSTAPETVQETTPPAQPAITPQPPATEARPAATKEAAVIPSSAPKGRRKDSATSVADRRAPLPPKFAGNDAVLLERLKKKHRLGKGEINVLGAMIQLCRESGQDYCYVKIPQLMVASGLKERQTQVVLRNLRELELIEKLADYSNVDRLGTKYKIHFDFF